MATKEAVAVFVDSAETWKKYIAAVGAAHVTKVYKAPDGFPAIVIERLTDGWCGTADAQIYPSNHYEFDRWAESRTDKKLYNAVERWDLGTEFSVGAWAKESVLPF